MISLPPCPECKSIYTYETEDRLVCPECGHEWQLTKEGSQGSEDFQVKDANGNVLSNGDTVIIMKDLKVKGSPNSLKMGTRVKGIRLVDGDHNIDCRIEGFGAMQLKSEFVKKA